MAARKTVKPKQVIEKSSSGFPIVGIGASAGGLAAFEAFFSGMPTRTDPGMAFVLVQHLAPDHKSILTELIQRYTRMEVFEVEDGMAVKPNCAYIIPPNRDMAFLSGRLQLMEPSAPRGQRMPIDFFFRSLAQDQHERAICIVLSGTGSDGTLGIRAIKDEGGMVMVQSPESTEYDGMPRSAIATGLVDYELPTAMMPRQLIAYVSHVVFHPANTAKPLPLKTESAMKKIFILLRAQTGHDFSQYKPSTINRRIERRLAVHQIETMDGYVKYLQQTPAEVEALFHDLLIGVTGFFRDPEAFQALERQMIPRLLAGKSPSTVIRVWAPGCSTGEEAYSIAILLQECMETMKRSFSAQIFATDIDSHAIDIARAGVYPASIAADLSPEQLARFFTIEPDGGTYRIHRGIRDMLIFSEQNIIKDPPISKLDLISCRNLMIYLGADLQKKLLSLFYYALNPNGLLFLGTSETVGEFSNVFSALDRKSKLYMRKDDLQGAQHLALNRLFPPMTAIESELRVTEKKVFPAKLPLREMAEKALLQQAALAGVIVNGKGDILYLHGRTGIYLEPTPGDAGINNVLKMAREGLRNDLLIALHKAVGTKEIVHCPGLCVKTDSRFTTVNLTVRPVAISPAATPEESLYLVVLEEEPASDPAHVQQAALRAIVGTNRSDMDADVVILALKQDLQAKETYIQSANEELAYSNGALESINEEMRSVNEELQSTNEEMQTSKEELQSINEELETINNELQIKVAELSRLNNDMNNLLSGTGIATIFLDQQLRIIRFTPTIVRIINLIPSDVGRPAAHILSNFVDYDQLMQDTQIVLDTLVHKEMEVRTTSDKWYRMHIQPYRTMDNVIEGAVITFVDINETVRIREALHKTTEISRLAVVVRDSYDAITVMDLNGLMIAWNPAAVRLYGWSEAEALGMPVSARIPKNRVEEDTKRIYRLALSEVLEPYHTQRLTKDGSVIDICMTTTALVNETGQMYAIATTERTEDLQADRMDGGRNEK